MAENGKVGRALAGFDIAAARDVFIHHYGSRTMSVESSDPDDRMEANRVVFKKKWGIQLAGPSDTFTEFFDAHPQLVGRRFEFESCYVSLKDEDV